MASMRRALALVVLVACVVAPSGSAREARAADGPRVTMFGDSVAGSLRYVPQAREILADGLDLRLELAPCRRLATLSCPYLGDRPPSVLDLIQSSTPAGLGDIVVIDVGYNESAASYDASMSTVLAALEAKGVEHVIWVTLRGLTDNYRQIDSIIHAEARGAPQVQVADWDAASAGNGDWFNADGLHLKAAGAVGLALFLRPFIFAACGSACQPASAAAGQAPRNVRRPTLRGAAVVGHTLTCTPGSWTGATPLAFLYGWVRHGREIAGASGHVRRLVAADRGQRLACRVWAGNAAGAGRATSRAVLVR